MKILSIAIVPILGILFQGGGQAPGSQPVSAPPQKASMRVIVDDKEVNFGANGVRTFGGRTFVPFRPLFEALGAEVDYDLVHKKVTATKDNNEVELTIGDRLARKNGAEIMMEAAPQILNSTTYVPLRFVAESLDADVNFDGKAGIITIKTSS